MTTELTNVNSQELIKQSQALAGTTGGNYVPFIPVITINNKKTEKEVEVDGEKQMVEVPAKKGFNLTTKDEATNEYVTNYFAENLKAVILRVRYAIASKNTVEPRFYSYEFDRFDDIIKVYDENHTELINSNYYNIKKFFATGELNTLGKPKTSFDLRVVVYININQEIYRLKLNNASRSSFFDYLKTFGQNDVFTAYQTKFNLLFNDKGAIKFWHIDFERGKSVDLAFEIPLQKQLQQYFDVEKYVKQPVAEEETVIQIEPEEPEKPEEQIEVSQIPF